MTRRKKLYLFLVLAWIAFIVGQSLMPAEASLSESSALLDPMQEISPEITHNFLRKSAHFVVFSVWGLLLCGLFLQYEHFHLLKPIGIALCGAFADETIQLFVPGRSSEVLDIWIDLGGATFGILLAYLLSSLVSQRKQKTETSS